MVVYHKKEHQMSRGKLGLTSGAVRGRYWAQAGIFHLCLVSTPDLKTVETGRTRRCVGNIPALTSQAHESCPLQWYTKSPPTTTFFTPWNFSLVHSTLHTHLAYWDKTLVWDRQSFSQENKMWKEMKAHQQNRWRPTQGRKTHRWDRGQGRADGEAGWSIGSWVDGTGKGEEQHHSGRLSKLIISASIIFHRETSIQGNWSPRATALPWQLSQVLIWVIN